MFQVMKNKMRVFTVRNARLSGGQAQSATHNDFSPRFFVARCALTVALILFCSPLICAAEPPVLKTLSARIVEVSEGGESVIELVSCCADE